MAHIPADTELWEKFKVWARNNSVGLKYQDDWENWWVCFFAGAQAGRNQAIAEEQRHASKEATRQRSAESFTPFGRDDD